MRRFALALVALACAGGVQATTPTADTARWWSHIRALAHDGMEGRDTGSRAYLRAADYVVNALKGAALSRPSGSVLVIHAIGRGATRPISRL